MYAVLSCRRRTLCEVHLDTRGIFERGAIYAPNCTSGLSGDSGFWGLIPDQKLSQVRHALTQLAPALATSPDQVTPGSLHIHVQYSSSLPREDINSIARTNNLLHSGANSFFG